MSRRRGLLLAVLAGLVLLAGLVWQKREDLTARQKLDALLGPETQGLLPAPPPLPDMELPEPPELGQLDAPNSFFGFNLPMFKSGVTVKETENAYELRIPLAEPGDENSVKLNVSPHRIEVAGQTGSKSGGATMTSSFMQSFTTREEVLPDKVSRKTEQKGESPELVITIPKKTPGQQSNPASQHAEPVAQPQEEPTPALEDPFENREHTVI